MISLYIHIPFCVKKCAYCDFLSFAASEAYKESYIRPLCREIEFAASYSDVCNADNTVYTIFFGGGTPSVLTLEQLDRIMCTIRDGYTIADDAEISLECNPGTVDAAFLKGIRSIGFNRLSMGLQSSVDSELKTLGRIHTYQDFLYTYTGARQAGFDNINIDIMSAIPGQTMKSYHKTLTNVVNIDPEHVSAYSLIIEEGTKFHEIYACDDGVTNTQCNERSGVKEPLPDEDTERGMYYMTEEILGGAGYKHYEISNYAKRGYECRHNNIYWMGGEYIGFGPGAASYFLGHRYKNTPDMSEYMEHAGNCKSYEGMKSIWEEDIYIDTAAKMEEYMYLGLRRMDGVSAAGWREQFDCDIRDVYGEVLDRLSEDGLISMADSTIRLTKRGIDVSNVVLANFLLD